MANAQGADVTLVPATATQLQLPGIISPTGWQLPDDLSVDDWASLGRQLHRVVESVQWWLGDWWVYGEHSYGERAGLVAEGIGC